MLLSNLPGANNSSRFLKFQVSICSVLLYTISSLTRFRLVLYTYIGILGVVDEISDTLSFIHCCISIWKYFQCTNHFWIVTFFSVYILIWPSGSKIGNRTGIKKKVATSNIMSGNNVYRMPIGRSLPGVPVLGSVRCGKRTVKIRLEPEFELRN